MAAAEEERSRQAGLLEGRQRLMAVLQQEHSSEAAEMHARAEAAVLQVRQRVRCHTDLLVMQSHNAHIGWKVHVQ